MKTRLLKGVGLSLLLAGCQIQAPTDQQDTIQVSGESMIEAVPDQAELRFAVEHQAATVESAQDQVDTVVGRLLQLAEGLEIERAAIQTTGLNIRPDYQWLGEPRRRSLNGYVVTRHITIQLNDLSQLGTLMSGAVKAGVNQVEPPQFDVGNRAAIQERALTNAVQAARSRAEAMAQAVDQSVGAAISLRAVDLSHAPPQPMMMRAAAESSGAASTYEVGRLTVAARVDATFRLE